MVRINFCKIRQMCPRENEKWILWRTNAGITCLTRSYTFVAAFIASSHDIRRCYTWQYFVYCSNSIGPEMKCFFFPFSMNTHNKMTWSSRDEWRGDLDIYALHLNQIEIKIANYCFWRPKLTSAARTIVIERAHLLFKSKLKLRIAWHVRLCSRANKPLNIF